MDIKIAIFVANITGRARCTALCKVMSRARMLGLKEMYIWVCWSHPRSDRHSPSFHGRIDGARRGNSRMHYQSVSKTGVTIASNLGVAELTIALHYVYDLGPYPIGPDSLLWDVGHQCYAHKMLTGRSAMFPTLRKKGSVSGFPNPEESPYDLFAVGHAGTAISTAVGMGSCQ